uniref:STAS domain-containing protein n=1 Tax=Geobacter sp. (strain M21) TaxID=443144 RepID=C6E308_GEOSM
MFRYALVRGKGDGEMTVVISGHALFTQAGDIERALRGALNACHHLTVDVGSARELDLTFRVLLCSLHRRSVLQNKTVTVRDTRATPREVREDIERVEGCLFKDGSDLCTLWRPRATPGDHAPGGR